MCLAEFKGFAQLYCLCRRVRIRNFVFPALVTAFSPRALLGFGVFKLRRVLVRKVPILRCRFAVHFGGLFMQGRFFVKMSEESVIDCGDRLQGEIILRKTI